MEAEDLGDSLHHLLTLTHPTWGAPVRLVDNSEDIISGGETFIRFPMDIVLPTDKDGEQPRARLVITNITRELIEQVRGINEPIEVQMDVIMGGHPDDVVATWPEFELSSVSINAVDLEADLGLPDSEIERSSTMVFTPVGYGALY